MKLVLEQFSITTKSTVILKFPLMCGNMALVSKIPSAFIGLLALLNFIPPIGKIHQGKSCVNRWRLTSHQEKVKQDKSQAHVKQKSSKRRAHVPLLSYTKSCDIHQYWFPCAFNSDSSPPDHPATAAG
ncbi:hypothetical protein O181_097237 [Austropuccinia psidii MF-1]|uniref:Uncharacterized protein n=1 Tax=Austropuccinia psidii MF-1 TaxID=1389203 RepID=A0A9Q3J8V3_9BASI|nr:hypothetical protein [Austropuccinia psidii MF-1]